MQQIDMQQRRDNAKPITVPKCEMLMIKVNAYGNRQSPLWKLDQVQYLKVHILDICATLEGLL